MTIPVQLPGDLIAHFDARAAQPPHPLSEHLSSTADLASDFAASFNGSELASIVASAHDAGKSHPDFQKYIQNPNGRRGSVKHALPGAMLFSQHRASLPMTHHMISYLLENIIAGHHRGLYDTNHRFLNSYQSLSTDGFPDAVQRFTALQAARLQDVPFSKEWENPLFCAALTRFLLSALTDADWLDTESYFRPELSTQITYTPPSFQQFQESFHRYTRSFPENSLTDYRNRTEQRATEPGTFYELTLPTGYGKTLASLAFALEHARHFGKKRIIVALPLINLTAETSTLYRHLFGGDHVIEDHSSLQPHTDHDADLTTEATYLTAENWNRPFVVTTSVQLFESLFANKPSKLRKLHRLADSVLILDEFHLLPAHLLPPILKMLDVLQMHFGVTVLLVSATPLPLSASKAVQQLGLNALPVPLLKPVTPPQRVHYSILGEQTIGNLLTEIPDQSTLFIVNTRKTAQELYLRVREQFTGRPLYHLSTSVVAGERADRVTAIKNEIDNCPIVIATTIVEAGIDISFDCVFRELAPLPSVIQAAGRCNRYGKLIYGDMRLFSLPGTPHLGPSYESGIRQLERMLEEKGPAVFSSAQSLNSHYKRVLDLAFRHSPLTDADALQFEKVAANFKTIEDRGITVLCPQAEGFQRTWLTDEKTRAWHRKVRRFTATASTELSHHITGRDGFPVWIGPYDEALGIVLL